MIFNIFVGLLVAFCHTSGASVSDVDKQEIVNSHNEWRQKAGATAMLRMKWNEELAEFAEATVAKCAFKHTTNEQRANIAGFPFIGENMYVYSAETTFKAAVDSWGSEEKDYDLASGSCTGVCGHYTQITWAKTSDVGCAVKKCDNVEGFGQGGHLIFCNYGIGGNMQGEKPFERGTPGSKCRAEFKADADANGLCIEDESTGGSDNGDKSGDKGTDKGTDNGDGGNGNNGGEGGNNGGEGKGKGEGGAGGKDGECKDLIWYCHDWMQACNKEEWTHRECRKSCKYC